MTGSVINTQLNSLKIANVTLTIVGGPNDGKSTTSDGSGNYSFQNLTPGTFTVNSHVGSPYVDGSQSITLGNGDTSIAILMDPILFKQSGVGDNVFSLPAWVSKIRVDATYPSSCQNFIVHVSSTPISLINIIIGTCSVADTRSPFAGTYAVKGGDTVTITSSTGISWTFTEAR